VPRDLFPFESRFVGADGARVHYVDEGRGSGLLMLHGNPTWSFLYRHMIRDLAPEFRCLALDYPGFGLSRAPAGYGFTPAEHARAVAAAVGVLGLESFIVLGHDWGGPIGLWLAARAPDRVAGLVLGNTWAWPVNGNPKFELFSRLVGGPLGRRLIERRNAFVEWLLPLGVRRARLTPAVMDAYRAPFADPAARRPTHVLPRAIVGARRFLMEVEAGLAALADKPVLLFWPTGDPAFGRRERAGFERRFPHHETRLLRGAGHYFPEDAPAEAAAAIRDWWQRQPATPDRGA
jgi:haloalkane dehalogenase